MADLQAELARFEAELAETTATQPGPSDVATASLPGPPPVLVPPGPALSLPPPPVQQPGPAMWQGAQHPAPQIAPMYPPPMAPAMGGGYYAAPQQAPAAYSYPTPVHPALDPGKAELLTGIKAAFESQKVSKKPKIGVARQAAGKKWIDPNLLEWPENDFRIFVGNLGNETNDDVLTKAFARFPTFQKAKVVRDKKTNKTKGYGFVSFGDPVEGAKTLREMDGKYVGNRPCSLKRSGWEQRNQEEQRFIPGYKKNKNHIGGAVQKKSGILHR